MSGCAQPFDAQERRFGGTVRRRPVGPRDPEGRPSDHHPRQLPLVGVARRACRPCDPAAQHADAVGDGAHLAELVADEHDREPIGDEATQGREQGLHLLRDEDRRGLVEDEHAAVARERLDDLDALLLPDREVRDAGVGIDRDAEAWRRPRRTRLRAASGRGAMPLDRPRTTFSATVMGRTSEKCCVTMPDARRDGVARRARSSRAGRRPRCCPRRGGSARRGCA